MSTDNTARDPLAVPVLEATPEEHALQSQHHVMTAMRGTLEGFLISNAENDHVVASQSGNALPVFRVSSKGKKTLDMVHMMELHELPAGDLLVFFRSCSMTPDYGCLTSDGGYGIFDAENTTLRQLSLNELYMLGEELIRTTFRELTLLKELTGLGATKAELCLS